MGPRAGGRARGLLAFAGGAAGVAGVAGLAGLSQRPAGPAGAMLGPRAVSAAGRTDGATPAVLRGAEAPPATVAAALPHVNDSRYGGRGSDPVPVGATALRLRAAEIEIVDVPVRDGWQVSARYDLENPGGAPVSQALVLAETACDKGRACTAQVGVLQDLGVRLGDDVLAAAAAPTAVLQSLSLGAPRGSLYQVTVPPRSTRRLDVEYRLDGSRGSSYGGVHFLSAAGRFAGVPGKVRYVVELKQPVPYVLYPKALQLAEFAERQWEGGPGAVVRLAFQATGAAARGDFLALFPADAVVGKTDAGTCDGFRGDRPKEELAGFLSRASKELLRACRELVYGLHGARKRGAAPVLPPWAAGLTVAMRPENRAFRESLLSPGEQAYIRALEEAERRR